MAISLLAYVVTFSGQLYFRRSFFRVITSTQQLHFRRSCFFSASAFFTSFFFRTGTSLQQLFFSEQLLFESETSSHHLRIESSLRKLLFRKATFLVEELFRMKTSTEQLLFWSKYFCFFRSATFWKKASFSEKQFHITHFFWRAAFFERLLFQKALFSIAATLPEELLSYNILLNSVPITYS